MRAKPALRTELLFYLSFFAAAALLVGVATTQVASTFAPGEEFWMVMALVALEVGVFVVFGRHLVTRLVLRPLGELTATADAVADGDLDARAPDAETRDFATLAERLNRMTDHLLDAQSQLVRSEKLASIGRLAAGIAHEVGNPLGAVGTYVEVLRRREADPEVVAGLSRELDRLDRIVRSLLDYARPQEEALDVVHPGEIVRGAFALLSAQGALKAVRAALDVPGDVPPIRARAHLLEQTIVNLVLNAVDAAPGAPVVLGARRSAYRPGRAPPRRTTDPAIASFSRRPTRRPARTEFAAGAPGALVFVADGGPGVPPEDRERVFEPFYTTKAPGRGTGLGLAIVARAVHEMGGVLWIDTAREGGAAFKMFFPATGEE
ncbi:MAG TPA: HAMP domain-containing sensor histidine kinase [Gemmatimonadales bacterium]|nr:HAMP domain-containing sensor histidine kinase [Gemmatimonadales bacterium]